MYVWPNSSKVFLAHEFFFSFRFKIPMQFSPERTGSLLDKDTGYAFRSNGKPCV